MGSGKKVNKGGKEKKSNASFEISETGRGEEKDHSRLNCGQNFGERNLIFG